jgi:tRNA(fMet)-specific endonuclease VapC
MKRFVIDTNIILHYMRGSRLYQQIELENELSSSDTIILVSVVSIAELEGFLQRNNYSEAKLQKLERMLAKVSIIGISNEAQELIEAFATLQNYSKNLHPTAKLGRSVGIGQNDLWIAATAWVGKAALITTDNDFDHLHRVFLNVIKYMV